MEAQQIVSMEDAWTRVASCLFQSVLAADIYEYELQDLLIPCVRKSASELRPVL